MKCKNLNQFVQKIAEKYKKNLSTVRKYQVI